MYVLGKRKEDTPIFKRVKTNLSGIRKDQSLYLK